MNSNREVDGQLVLQYQSGEAKALPKLVKRWHKQFCKKAYWLVRDQDIAKDIAQESWRIIINKMDRLKDPNSFGNWALRIVQTQSLDVLRAKSRERERQQQYYKTQNNEAVDTNYSEDLKQTVLKGIYELSTQQQAVIKLFYVEDYALKEISELLNISIGTAKSRLFYAREKLKQILKDRTELS
ncbi:RNA polymerase subunit sigma-24 [Flavobacteriales bacterium 34_180_T64]|nr:RNA polymerase subunit sigma-24 [Flavobacteriales bacterium 34_180_T64]